ncbi:HD domain-containing protein, partial [Priestia filamentosa]|uniref:HD-GYP domain-containing protein n=1 Tax=Priestia filamentosa TaxID=1402861 RepID=UPI00397B6A54
MKWEEVSLKLVGAMVKKDIVIEENVVIKQDSLLSSKDIKYLLIHDIKKVLIERIHIEKPLLLQLESFIVRSEQPLFWEEYIDTLEATKIFFTLLEKGSNEDPEPLLLKVHNLISLLENRKEFFRYVYTVVGHEDSLYRHSLNVAIIAFVLGELTLLEKPMLLSQMGFLHDIGKTRIDQEILYKEGKLTNEEITHVHKHTILGEQLTKSLGIYNIDIQEAALFHHENRKETGYPYQIDASTLSYGIQIISFIDALDTLSSDRIYKSKTTLFNALKILYFD